MPETKTRKTDKFPPWAYTTFSNETLKAMMHPDEPARQRVFACYARYAWGYDSPFVVRPWDKKRATHANVADWLDMSEPRLVAIHASLVADGWVIEDAKRIIPNPAPPERPAKTKVPDPHELYPELPSREAFRALEDPALADDRKKALEHWAEVRRREYAIDEKYDAMVAAFVADRTTDRTMNENPPYDQEPVIVRSDATLLVTANRKQLGAVGRSNVETTEQQKVRATRGSELELIEKTLVEMFGERLHDTPTPKLIRQIHSALRGAPPQNLFFRWRERAGSIKAFGICKLIADDVGKAWQADQHKRERALAAKKERDVQTEASARETATKFLNDPHATEDEKQLAHEILGTATKGARG
jgi:hypothetical protein